VRHLGEAETDKAEWKYTVDFHVCFFVFDSGRGIRQLNERSSLPGWDFAMGYNPT